MNTKRQKKVSTNPPLIRSISDFKAALQCFQNVNNQTIMKDPSAILDTIGLKSLLHNMEYIWNKIDCGELEQSLIQDDDDDTNSSSGRTRATNVITESIPVSQSSSNDSAFVGRNIASSKSIGINRAITSTTTASQGNQIIMKDNNEIRWTKKEEKENIGKKQNHSERCNESSINNEYDSDATTMSPAPPSSPIVVTISESRTHTNKIADTSTDLSSFSTYSNQHPHRGHDEMNKEEEKYDSDHDSDATTVMSISSPSSHMLLPLSLSSATKNVISISKENRKHIHDDEKEISKDRFPASNENKDESFHDEKECKNDHLESSSLAPEKNKSGPLESSTRSTSTKSQIMTSTNKPSSPLNLYPSSSNHSNGTSTVNLPLLSTNHINTENTMRTPIVLEKKHSVLNNIMGSTSGCCTDMIIEQRNQSGGRVRYNTSNPKSHSSRKRKRPPTYGSGGNRKLRNKESIQSWEERLHRMNPIIKQQKCSRGDDDEEEEIDGTTTACCDNKKMERMATTRKRHTKMSMDDFAFHSQSSQPLDF
jgi:hypothetical protein